jgi:YfiH family protein
LNHSQTRSAPGFVFGRSPVTERIDDSGEIRLLRYKPWEGVPGLVQGVTVKNDSGRGIDYSRLEAAAGNMGFGKSLRLKQVHGRIVLDLDRPEDAALFGAGCPEADGLIGSAAGILGLVSAADCVPAFLLDRVHRRWAAVHAGWRGVVAGVLDKAIRVMALDSSSAPDELELYLGPSVCGQCYKVGTDVAEQLAVSGNATGIEERDGRWFADLRAILRTQALNSGIADSSVALSAYCTSCHNQMFCSFRAEGGAGLGFMWGIIGFAG